MTTHKEFIGLLMTPDAGKYGHVLVRAAYKVVTNEDWEHPTIEMGLSTYMSHNEDDVAFAVPFQCAAPAYIKLRDFCFEKDGHEP